MDGHHDFTGIAMVALAAMACGVLFARLKQPAIVGYILAGVLLGPSVLGLVQDRAAVSLLAELGVIMLLFVIGTELSVKRFAEVWRVAVLTTLLQIAGSVGMMLVAKGLFGWTTGMSILLGYAVALSSTAVVIKLLQQTGELDSSAGRLTVGVLIAQDMAVVPMMLSLNTLTSGGFSPIETGKVVASIAVLAALVVFLLKREIRIPYASLVADHADLGPLAAFAWCFGAAALAGLAGLSPGYGAFLIGLIIGNSKHGHEITRHAMSIQAILLMVFFLSVGLLLDLGFLWDNIGSVLLLLLVVTVFKTILNIGALRLQRVSWGDAFLAGVALAQIGEFSFLLSGAGVAKGLLKSDQAQLVVAVSVLSLTISPIWLLTMRRLAAAGGAFSSLGTLLESIYGSEARATHRVYVAVRFQMRRLPLPARFKRHRKAVPPPPKPVSPNVIAPQATDPEEIAPEDTKRVETDEPTWTKPAAQSGSVPSPDQTVESAPQSEALSARDEDCAPDTSPDPSSSDEPQPSSQPVARSQSVERPPHA